VRFIIDNSLSPALSHKLQQAGHESVHVRDYGLQNSDDETIFDRAAEEDRVVVSADTDFGTILTTRGATNPSVILFRSDSPRRPEAQGEALLANLPNLIDLLNRGSIVVFEGGRLRSRLLPLFRTGRSRN
jgi:predicted nuclease of predicted toxin-antitoxin system